MRWVLGLVTVAACLTACSGGDAGGGAGSGGGGTVVAAPHGLTFLVEQTRTELPTRRLSLEVVNHAAHDVQVVRLELSSSRLDSPATAGDPEPTLVGAGTEVDFPATMPVARCGSHGIDATLRATYLVDGERRTSEVTPTDRFGSVDDFMTRDCAERTAREAATLTVDPTFRVSGTGKASVLHYGITVTPRRDAATVRLGPVGTTVMLRSPGAAGDHVDRTIHAGGAPFRIDVPLVPTRCDPHVVAEDKVGTLLQLGVSAAHLRRTAFFLRLTDAQKGQLFDYLSAHCGWD